MPQVQPLHLAAGPDMRHGMRYERDHLARRWPEVDERSVPARERLARPLEATAARRALACLGAGVGAGRGGAGEVR